MELRARPSVPLTTRTSTEDLTCPEWGPQPSPSLSPRVRSWARPLESQLNTFDTDLFCLRAQARGCRGVQTRPRPREGETWRAGQAGAAVGLPAAAGASGGAGPRPEKRRQKVSGRLWPAVWLRAVSAGFSWVPGRELTSPSPPLTCKARCWLDTPTGRLRKSWPPSLSLGPRRGVRFDWSRGRRRKHLPIPGT